MEPTPGTPSLLRAINDRSALWLLSERGPLSRTQLGALTGLSKPTASQLVDRLESAGLIELVPADESEPAAGGPGRAARRYRIRPAAAHVAGLYVTPARIEVRLSDLAGNVVGEHTLRTPGRSVADPVERVRAALRSAAEPAGLTVAALHHAVVGIEGAINPVTGRLGYARHMAGWHEPDLLPRLRSELTGLGEPDPAVDIENDVNLAAIAEGAEGDAGQALDYVVLWISSGIGAAVVIDGRLHRGATGGAGEVGYMPVPGAPMVRTIGRGTTGGFQNVAGAPAILKLARAHDFTGTGAAAVVARAAAAGALGDAFLRELGDRVATGLAPIVAVLDPELIVLTGPTLRAGGDRLRDAIAEALRGMAIPRPRLVVSRVPGNPVLAGAIHAALAATRETVFSGTVPTNLRTIPSAP